MRISVLIGTFGEERWRTLAQERAVPSVADQPVHDIHHVHLADGTLASARNAAATAAQGDWLCFLDADDELAPGYIAAMNSMIEDYENDLRTTSGELRPELYTPQVSYAHKGRMEQPKFWPQVPLDQANWLVIGTVVPRDLFRRVGGFGEWPIYEDWALFAACHKVGARVVKVPEAVYIAHRSRGSRNSSLTREERTRVHYEIGRALFPDLYGEEWLARHLRNAAIPPRRARRSAA